MAGYALAGFVVLMPLYGLTKEPMVLAPLLIFIGFRLAILWME